MTLMTRYCQQEASVASITCSLIIVRVEKASNPSETLPTSLGSDATKAPPKPLAFGKYSTKQEESIFTVRSMDMNVDVLRTVDEHV
jgi:hypothetical protein